jgi:uracil-DNA glycosylase family 4
MNQGQKRVLGAGAIEPLVFFLGESPGRLGADKTGIPFTQDRCGRLLRKMIEEIKLHPYEIYISNVLKCNPRNEKGKNRRPSNEELVNCHEYLLAELHAVRARVVVPLGEIASKALLGKKVRMEEINAKIFNHVEFGVIFPLYHPGYIIRGNYSLSEYGNDFACLRALSKP